MIRETWRYADICAWAEKRGPLVKYWWFVTGLLQALYGRLLLERICKWRGHDVECYGIVGPDSGREQFYCNRCGESWHHIYY